jgi:hypothetical protein
MSWWPWEHEDEIVSQPEHVDGSAAGPPIDALAAAADAERLGWLPWTHSHDGSERPDDDVTAPEAVEQAAEAPVEDDADWDDGPKGSWAAFSVVPGEDELVAPETVEAPDEDDYGFHDVEEADARRETSAAAIGEDVEESATVDEPAPVDVDLQAAEVVDEESEGAVSAADDLESEPVAEAADLLEPAEPVDETGAGPAEDVEPSVPVRRARRWPWSRHVEAPSESASEAESAEGGVAEAPAAAAAAEMVEEPEVLGPPLELTLPAPSASETAQLSLLDEVADQEPGVTDGVSSTGEVVGRDPAALADVVAVGAVADGSAPAPDVDADEGEGDEPRRGYRSLRRSRKRGRLGRMAAAKKDLSPAARVATVAGRVARIVALVAVTVVVLAGLVFGLVLGVNAFARWNARRIAAQTGSAATATQDNVLVIGVTDGQAVGFAALKAERSDRRVLGIAIPDGAFVEVPGQGFERLGDSYVQGPDVSKDAVSNYLMVRFGSYIVVSGEAYQQLMNSQNVGGIMGQVQATDMSASDRNELAQYFSTIGTKNVWIVPLPVKPIAVGDQQYFEPEKAQVADLLLQWWGVKVDEQKSMPRVVVYNGVGTPGIAGKAAQQLIRKGFEVVDSGNADNFKHKTTLILLYHGTPAEAQGVHDALGTGQVLVQSAPQDIADMIVIIGADYQPPADVTEVTPTPAP